jgi:hypothetical protein
MKVGQVYQSIKQKDKQFVVTSSNKYDWKSYVISSEGVGSCRWKSDIRKMKLIAEYPTWQEAVNSKEFNNK